jgi:hemoglobin
LNLEKSQTLYDLIGPAFIEKAVTEFYRRAFVDPMISHFFFHSDINHITKEQIDFASAMLGGPQNYRGKSLKAAHAPFSIRPPHFGRRQILMAEVLIDLELDKELAAQWLTLENQFKNVIINSSHK